MNKRVITLINGYELEKRNSMNIYLSNLYNSLKNTNPPIIPGAGKNIIQQIKDII